MLVFNLIIPQKCETLTFPPPSLSWRSQASGKRGQELSRLKGRQTSQRNFLLAFLGSDLQN